MESVWTLLWRGFAERYGLLKLVHVVVQPCDGFWMRRV
jgi:hypothetical protein